MSKSRRFIVRPEKPALIRRNGRFSNQVPGAEAGKLRSAEQSVNLEMDPGAFSSYYS